MTWWERLGSIIENNGLAIEDVAEKAGVPVKSLYGYLKGEVQQPRGDVVARLANAVGTTERSLRYGDTESTLSRRVPLIDMSKLGTLKATDSPADLWDGIRSIQTQQSDGDESFAVTLLDDSGATYFFHKNDIVICDPSAKIEPGCFVLIVKTDEQRPYFGKFKPAAHGELRRFTLVRDGQFFPDIEISGRSQGFILGRVIRHIREV